MFCIHCGIPLPEGANFCYKCGCKQEIGITPQIQKRAFSYLNLVKYEFDEVEMVENYNPVNLLMRDDPLSLPTKEVKLEPMMSSSSANLFRVFMTPSAFVHNLTT